MYQSGIKRGIDIFLAVLLLPIFILTVIPIGILIKREDGGNIFYNGERIGKDMKPFKMHKFRTMKMNASDIRNADGSTFNSDTDSRVTRIGHILRKTSLDELPQIINVLKGDMSFVGPRPSPLGNINKYPDYYFKKFEIRPGITGLTQATLRNSASMEERMKLDTFYRNRVRPTMDIYIILKTISSVLMRKNINRK